MKKKFRSFRKARAYARSLGLNTKEEWKKFTRSGNKPDDIPANPELVYDEWIGYGDFLGTGRKRPGGPYVSYKEVLKYGNMLAEMGMYTREQWREYVNKGLKPDNIPSNLELVYKQYGFTYKKFFGRQFLSYEESKKYIQENEPEIKTSDDYIAYASSGRRPKFISSNPNKYYQEWNGWRNYLSRKR